MQCKAKTKSGLACLCWLLLALLFLSLRVADLKSLGTEPTWKLYATFDNIGGLKVSSPVKIGGVVIGRVTDISLDDKTLSPRVTMDISEQYANKIPDTSSLAIRTRVCWVSSSSRST